MHEFSIAEGLLELVIPKAEAEGAAKILRVDLRVGALSGVVPEALQFAFQSLTHGTLAEGARLAIEEVPVACRCARCEKDFAAEGYSYRCPDCGELSAQVVRGRELQVVSVEIA